VDKVLGLSAKQPVATSTIDGSAPAEGDDTSAETPAEEVTPA
jgi:hypothetical protein